MGHSSLRLVVLVAVASIGCAPAEEPVAERTEELQWQYMGDGYAEVALAVPGALGDAVRAEATVLSPTYLDGGAPMLASDGTPIRGTCGVTFVSPSYAITASHCVDDIAEPHDLDVETYALGPNVPWQQAKNLSGTFPAWSHPVMTAQDGYVVDTHTCTVVKRCGGKTFNGSIDCPEIPDLGVDVALLRCPSAPACDTGWVNVATSDPPGVEVAMPWTHEVYSVSSNPASDEFQHYTTYPNLDRRQNFHYFGNGRNQLLPLVSTPFWEMGNSIAHVKGAIATGGDVRYTDLIGCHGTSGAGIMQLESTGDYSLLGPVAATTWWGPPNIEVLCVNPSAAGPGQDLFGYTRPHHTSLVADDADGDCKLLTCGSGGIVMNLFLWLRCHRLRIPEEVTFPDWPWLWPCLDCPPWDRVRVWNEPFVRVEPGTRISIPGETFTRGATYRFSVRVASLEGGSGAITVRLGEQVVVERAEPSFEGGEHAGLVSASFVAEAGGTQTLSLEVDRASEGALDLTEIVVVRDGATNRFDRFDLRLGAGLLSPSVEDGTLVPMRFTGDGRGGYAAFLERGERMLLTRQALTPGVTYTLTFVASTDGPLTCGTIFADGSETAVACDATRGLGTAVLRSEGGAQPLAVYIETPLEREPTTIDDLTLR